MMMRNAHNRADRHGEEGASATVFLLSLVAVLAMTMLALDGGSLFVSRRGQIAETDSSAHAVALHLINDPCADQATVDGIADDLIAANGATTTREGPVDVTYVGGACSNTAGTVTVETSNPVELYFAPLFGFDSINSDASTTVGYGQVNTLEGLRPIGICAADPHYPEWQQYFTDLRLDPDNARDNYEAAIDDTDDHYADELPGFIAHPTSNKDGVPYDGADVVHRVVFERLADSDGSDCPGAAGNFGWLDFDAGGGGNSQLVARIYDGYEGAVTLGTGGDGDEDCDAEDPPLDECPPQTGAHGSATQNALDSLVCAPGLPADHESCATIYIVVYSDLDGSGNNARFDLQSFAGIVLRDHDVGTGQLGGENYLDIEFTDERVSGPLSPFTPGSTAPLGVEQCGVDGAEYGCPS